MLILYLFSPYYYIFHSFSTSQPVPQPVKTLQPQPVQQQPQPVQPQPQQTAVLQQATKPVQPQPMQPMQQQIITPKPQIPQSASMPGIH